MAIKEQDCCIIQTRKNRKVLFDIYCTAGYPQPDSTLRVIRSLQEKRRRPCRIRHALYDPVGRRASDPAQQHHCALANGMTIKRLFEQLKGSVRKTDIPVILMG